MDLHSTEREMLLFKHEALQQQLRLVNESVIVTLELNYPSLIYFTIPETSMDGLSQTRQGISSIFTRLLIFYGTLKSVLFDVGRDICNAQRMRSFQIVLKLILLSSKRDPTTQDRYFGSQQTRNKESSFTSQRIAHTLVDMTNLNKSNGKMRSNISLLDLHVDSLKTVLQRHLELALPMHCPQELSLYNISMKILLHCFRAYAIIGCYKDAEDLLNNYVVNSPDTQNIDGQSCSWGPLDSDILKKIFAKIGGLILTNSEIFPIICYEVEGLCLFDFTGSIQPCVFTENGGEERASKYFSASAYSTHFISALNLVAATTDELAVHLRLHANDMIVATNPVWNLNLHFHLRKRQILSKLEHIFQSRHLIPLRSDGIWNGASWLTSSKDPVECFRRESAFDIVFLGWAPNIYISVLHSHIAELSMLCLMRFHTFFLSSRLDSPLCLIRRVTMSESFVKSIIRAWYPLVKYIKHTHHCSRTHVISHNNPQVPSSPVRIFECWSQTWYECLYIIIAHRCVAMLLTGVRNIAGVYRMTNRPAPRLISQASLFSYRLWRPLIDLSRPMGRGEICPKVKENEERGTAKNLSVMAEIILNFYEFAEKMLVAVHRTETSLKRFKRGTTSKCGNSSNLSDGDKIRRQLAIDVIKFKLVSKTIKDHLFIKD